MRTAALQTRLPSVPTIALCLVLASCAPSGAPQTVVPGGPAQPNTALGHIAPNAATEGAAGPSSIASGEEGSAATGASSGTASGSGGGGGGDAAGAARMPGET